MNFWESDAGHRIMGRILDMEKNKFDILRDINAKMDGTRFIEDRKVKLSELNPGDHFKEGNTVYLLARMDDGATYSINEKNGNLAFLGYEDEPWHEDEEIILMKKVLMINE